VSECDCNTIPITCSRVLNSSQGRLDLGGLVFTSLDDECRAFGGGNQPRGDGRCAGVTAGGRGLLRSRTRPTLNRQVDSVSV